MAEAKMEATVGIRFGIGEDSGQSVSFDYKPPFKFTGKLETVTIKITDHPLTEEQLQKYREAQLKSALSR